MNDVSVKERLKNLRNETGKTFDELLILYGIERLLYRISVSKYRYNFILKGGALLYTILDNKARMTRDIDVLARKLHNSKENIQSIMEEVCHIEVDDALVFDKGSIVAEDIAQDAEYHGIRFVITAYLGRTKIHLQMDIGFSDTVYPEPTDMEFPTLLRMDTPRLLAYQIETVVAEKYEAMTSLGMKNSRFKDFYDILMLSRSRKFHGYVLQEALVSTFARRNTDFDYYIYTEEYVFAKERLWQGFKHRIGANLDISFAEVVQEIGRFILPVQKNIEEKRIFSAVWNNKEWLPS